MSTKTDPLSVAFDALFRIHDQGTDSGYVPTVRSDIKFFWNRSSVSRGPRLYDPGIVLIGSGHKLGYLGERTFRYDPDNCLVLSIPSAFESETIASASEPLIGLFVNIDHLLVAELASAMGIHSNRQLANEFDVQPSFEPVPMLDALRDTAVRLISALSNPEESDVIGEALKRELVYRVLTGPGARTLLALSRDSSVNAKIAKAVATLHREFESSFSIDALARETGMSVSAFHRGFREVTGDSPLQYLKKIRLHHARALLSEGGMRPTAVAGKVGYASVSQFSREFSRHFNFPPSAAMKLEERLP